MPVTVPGEFGFPGNVNPLIYPAGKTNARARKEYVDELITKAGGDPAIIKRIELAEADAQVLRNPRANPELTCNQDQYNDGLNVFMETMYLADYARTRVDAKDQMLV